MSLKVVGIKIKNVLGIEELEINPSGNIIQIAGHNGSGKTSIIESIKDALGVSEYSTLLRNGEESGSIVLDLGEMMVTKKYNAKGSTVSVQGRVMGTDSMSNISSPAKVLKSLVSPNSIDPVRLLTAKPKELLDAVLNALPMVASGERLKSITGTSHPTDQHALVVISKVSAGLTEERRDVNRDLKTASITKEQLQETIPEDVATLTELEEEIAGNLDAIDKIKSSARTAKKEVRFKFSEELEALGKKLADKWGELEAIKDEIHVLDTEHTLLEAQREGEADRAEAAELAKEQVYLDSNVELQKGLLQNAVVSNTQRQILEWNSKISKWQSVSDGLTTAIKSLQDYKEELCQDLPIEGMAITDGMLSMNGIPFATLNTAARIDLVLELAKLSAGTLGLIVLDNSECMDDESYKMFLEKAAKTDLTFIVARVENQDLDIS